MPSVLHVELVEQTATALQLRLWRDEPNAPRTRTLELAEIADLVAQAETDYYSPLPAKLKEVGQSLFRWLDGGERWLSTEIEASANQADVLVLAIDSPHGLAHLPWEVLHDGSGFLVHALNPPVLPVRWRKANLGAHPVANRPLQALFMASSPEDVQPELNYEQEEAEIVAATERWPMDLVVEESGSLEELGALMQDYGPRFFDVLHLTGHADHADDGTPIFLLEDSEGRRADATPLQIARSLNVANRPPLVFLSGCRTGEAPRHGEVRSFAEQLIANGFRTVLGWGRSVRDVEATLAAQLVYQRLAGGDALPLALVQAHQELFESGARDWHLLRLFCAGNPPAQLVTPLMTAGRRRFIPRPSESEFLDPLTNAVKVATRAGFVGRRRLLQRSLKALRKPEGRRVGLLLQGQGGRGKSSVAARLCDRLRREFQRVVVIGRLDEPSLINAWAPRLPDDAARQALRDPSTELRYRIQATLDRLAAEGCPTPLFILDDFEQNQPNAPEGDLAVAPHSATVLLPLLEALADAGLGRVFITCRYALPAPFASYLLSADVPPLDATERMKQSQRLDQKAARQAKDANLLARALDAADGNPRLFEWLHAVLERPGLDHASILAELEAVTEEFREHILARRLLASLHEDDQVLLGRMLLVTIPVPFAAVHALDPDRDEAGVRQALAQAAGLGLVDVTDEDGQQHYRVPNQLNGSNPPLLIVPNTEVRATLADRAFHVLVSAWLIQDASESRVLELIRLAVESGNRIEAVALVDNLTTRWLVQNRYREAHALLARVIDNADRHHGLLLNLAWASEQLGNGDEAGKLLREAATACPEDEERGRADIFFHLANWLLARGQLDEGLRILREERLPLVEKLDDARGRAVTLGQIADILHSRGESDEALRIRREEQLPVFKRLGNVREQAVTLAMIAEAMMTRGELDEALRIFREEVLPVFEKRGEVRERAVTLGKIAVIMRARGELDEALRIRCEEELPVYDQLGSVRDVIVARVNIALLLHERSRKNDVPAIVEHLAWAYNAAAQRGYREAAQIADILQRFGIPLPDGPHDTV